MAFPHLLLAAVAGRDESGAGAARLRFETAT